MAWLNPFLAEYEVWRQNNVVRGWASPNEERRFGGYWMPNIGQQIAPIMSRYVCRFDYRNDVNSILWVEWLLRPTGPFKLGAESGANGLGQELDLEIEYHPDADPIVGLPGITWTFKYHRRTFQDDVSTVLVQNNVGENGRYTDFDFHWPPPRAIGGRPIAYVTSFLPGQDTDWAITSPDFFCFFTSISENREIPNNPSGAETNSAPAYLRRIALSEL